MRFNKYSDYITTLTYNATARCSLRIDLYDMKNTIESELMFMERFYHFRRLPLYDGYDAEYEAKFFLNAACLCYIPYDTVGYEYIREKLGGESVVEYRYGNVMKKLKYMGIILDEADKKKLHDLFASQETGVFRLDAAGIAALYLRVRTAVEGECLSLRRGVASLLLSKAFTAKIKELAEVALENSLETIDINEYLPKYELYTLYGKDTEYLDFLFEAQSFPELYEYEISIEDFAKVNKNQMTSYMLGAKDKAAKIGDKITLTYDNMQMSGEITGIRNYRSYLEIPAEKYGFGVGTYNPYFYDNETVMKNGGVLLADFKIEQTTKTSDVFTAYYHAYELEGVEDLKELCLVKRDMGIYAHVGYSSEFILKECGGGRTIRGISHKPAELNISKEGLLRAMEAGIPSIPSRKEIENGCFSEKDYKDCVWLIRLEITEE